jgi:hypothetical protein
VWWSYPRASAFKMGAPTLVVITLAVVCAVLAAKETGADTSIILSVLILVLIALVAFMFSLRNTYFSLYLGHRTSSTLSQPSQQIFSKVIHMLNMLSLSFNIFCVI